MVITAQGTVPISGKVFCEKILDPSAQTAINPCGEILTFEQNEKQKNACKSLPQVENWEEVDINVILPGKQELDNADFIASEDLSEVSTPPPSQIAIDKSGLSYDLIRLNFSEQDTYPSWDSKKSTLRHSLSYKSLPTTPTTAPIISSPSQLSNTDPRVWKATIEKLKQSIAIILPVKKSSRRRKPKSRFDPETITYLRRTRYNSDHLRMLSAEMNMIRHKKPLGPCKQREFLPRREDIFIRAKPSPLSQCELA